ncbi:hypothetical protein KPATCC21470_2344 [Kitasatospora purpeofusca]
MTGRQVMGRSGMIISERGARRKSERPTSGAGAGAGGSADA